MTYRIRGYQVNLKLTPEEIDQLIASLELTDPGGELLKAFKQYRQEEGFV